MHRFLSDMPFYFNQSKAPENFYEFPDLNNKNKGINVLKQESHSDSLVSSLAYFLSNSGYYNESIIWFQQLVKFFPKKTDFWKSLGDANLAIKNKEEARKAYIVYIELMREKGLDEVIPERILGFIDGDSKILKKVNENLIFLDKIDYLLWFEGYLGTYPIKAKVLIRNGLVERVSYAYESKKKMDKLGGT